MSILLENQIKIHNTSKVKASQLQGNLVKIIWIYILYITGLVNSWTKNHIAAVIYFIWT